MTHYPQSIKNNSQTKSGSLLGSAANEPDCFGHEDDHIWGQFFLESSIDYFGKQSTWRNGIFK